MADDNKVFDITSPRATTSGIANVPSDTLAPPNSGDVIKPSLPISGAASSSVSIPVFDQSVPSEPVPKTDIGPDTPSTTQDYSVPTDQPSQAAAPEPAIASPQPPTSQIPPPAAILPEAPQTAAQPLPTQSSQTLPPPTEDPLPLDVPVATLPVAPKVPDPGLPPAEEGAANVPQFGALQPKIDAHPLFSGAKTPPPKHHHKPRLLWMFVSLLVAVILLYLAVDAGLVRGASHLPFHIFKQDVVATTTPTIQTTTTSATKTAATADPYANWKTYCDTTTKGCFKYPADWSLTSGASTNTQVQNADDTVHIVYDANYNCGCSSQSFYTARLDSLAAASPLLQIVGGYYTTSNDPIYYLIDSSSAQKYGLATGKTSTTVGTLSVTQGTKQISLSAYNAKLTPPIKTADANSWLSSAEGSNALLVMKSFYYQK